MLLRITGGEQPACIYWSEAPAAVALHAGGFLVIPCFDHQGVRGPTLLAELAGRSVEFGICAQLYVSGGHLRSLSDFASRSGAELVGVGVNAHKLPSCESAWKAMAPETCARAALRHNLQELAEAEGRRLRAGVRSFEKFKKVRKAQCQWTDGPAEFDDLVDTWKDAITAGWVEVPMEQEEPSAALRARGGA